MPQPPRPEAPPARRYFTPERLGPWCVSCSVRLPLWMSVTGEHQHPTCTPEFRAAYAALKRSEARRALHQKATAHDA